MTIASSRLLRALFDESPDPIAVTNGAQRVIGVNRAFEAAFRCTLGQVAGQPLWRFCTPEGGAAATLYHGNTAPIRLFTCRRQDGSTFHARAALMPVKGEKGQPPGTALVFRRMDEAETRAAAAERALAAANGARSRVNEFLQLYASAAAHDLQSPLNSVTVAAELLAGDVAQGEYGEARELADAVLEGARRASSLARRLGAFARSACSVPEIETIPLEDVVAEAVGTLGVQIEGSDARLDVGELPILPCDRAQMTLVLHNLIGNAILYGPDDAAPEISIGARLDRDPALGDAWVISVADNGIGIPAERAEEVFAPLKRLHGPESGYPGEGLGLTLCRRIVENHGGTIALDTAHAGPGSRFILRLPAAPQAVDPVAPRDAGATERETIRS